MRRRDEALAVDFQVHDAVGRIVELAPGMPMGGAVGIGAELVVAKIHRGRQSLELRNFYVLYRHAVWIYGQVVWIQV
ncbi:hypothetical protein D9M73_252990 [compost metagenome]